MTNEPNVPNINRLITAIKAEDAHFSMANYDNDDGHLGTNGPEQIRKNKELGCGTPSCICGWANYLKFVEDDDASGLFYGLSNDYDAAEWLGINDEEDWDEMYFPFGYANKDHPYTKDGAINMLTNFAETGEVVWKEHTQS